MFIPNQTELYRDDLDGAVKQARTTTYKAHSKDGMVVQGKMEMDYPHSEKQCILTYSREGARLKSILFGKNGKEVKTYNSWGFTSEVIYYDAKGNLKQTQTHRCDDERKHVLESITVNADGSLYSRTLNTYNDAGKQLSHVLTLGQEERVISRTVYEYDERNNPVSIIGYDADGKMKSNHTYKYNDEGKVIDNITKYFEKDCFRLGSRHTQKYNEHGDTIEYVFYDAYDNVKDTYTYTHQYDSEGKLIIPPPPPQEPEPESLLETEEDVNDDKGNWIKKTTFYNKLPLNIITRELIYYGDPNENEEMLTHPFTEASMDKEEVVDVSSLPPELSLEETKWLMEVSSNSPESFSAVRYFVLQFKIAPSVRMYTGPHIEAHALLQELKEELGAKEIHSYSTVWGGRGEQIHRYTLSFPSHWGYLLQATGINGHSADEFDVPDSISKKSYNDGNIYVSQFQLLRPSEASAKRDEYFEETLDEYIERCSLHKKPDKPVINMIEVEGNSFSIVEHAVDDNFEIRDLDINYGSGFQKFHDELMFRFNSSTKGLVLFHGQPGTGKTYYIRHLLRKMVSNKKIVIYMPPNMVDHLVEPMFMTFLAGEIREWSQSGHFCVLLIEDAEPLLAKRQEGVRIQGVTNLLNMSDGLLNDMLNLQIICTFNVDLRKLDSALLRPGRLIARKEFKPLAELDANLLAQRLGIKHHFTKPATLGEIYAMQEHKSTLIHDVEHDKGASTNIDDLL